LSNKKSASRKLKQGEELFTKGDIESARKCFLTLIDTPYPPKEAYNNLGVIAFHEGNFRDAERYFSESLAIDPTYEDAATNYAELLEIIRQKQSVTYLPEEKKRIAFLCLPGLESFLGDIVDFLKSRYEVRTIYSRDLQKLSKAVEWADVIWLEWANDLAAHLTHREGILDDKQVICRVHSYEVLDGYLPRVNWAKVSKAIFVAPHVLDIAMKMYPTLIDKAKTAIIPNGIDLDKFPYRERKPGFVLAVVGHVNHKKNPAIWPEILHRLAKIDNRYELKIAGAVQEARYGLYLEHIFRHHGLEKQVRFFGYVNDVARWLEEEKINYLLTTSIFESFGYAIGEAMAMGIQPVIHWFPGAEILWPKKCLFSSVEDAVAIVKDTNNYSSTAYRRFVSERYGLDEQCKAVGELIDDMLEHGLRENALSVDTTRSTATI